MAVSIYSTGPSLTYGNRVDLYVWADGEAFFYGTCMFTYLSESGINIERSHTYETVSTDTIFESWDSILFIPEKSESKASLLEKELNMNGGTFIHSLDVRKGLVKLFIQGHTHRWNICSVLYQIAFGSQAISSLLRDLVSEQAYYQEFMVLMEYKSNRSLYEQTTFLDSDKEVLIISEDGELLFKTNFNPYDDRETDKFSIGDYRKVSYIPNEFYPSLESTVVISEVAGSKMVRKLCEYANKIAWDMSLKDTRKLMGYTENCLIMADTILTEKNCGVLYDDELVQGGFFGFSGIDTIEIAKIVDTSDGNILIDDIGGISILDRYEGSTPVIRVITVDGMFGMTAPSVLGGIPAKELLKHLSNEKGPEAELIEHTLNSGILDIEKSHTYKRRIF